MDWKSIICGALRDTLAIVCALLIVLPLALLAWIFSTAVEWIVACFPPRPLDASCASTLKGVTKAMPYQAYLAETKGTPAPVKPASTPVLPTEATLSAELAQWTRELNVYASAFGVSFTQDQAARLYLHCSRTQSEVGE